MAKSGMCDLCFVAEIENAAGWRSKFEKQERIKVALVRDLVSV